MNDYNLANEDWVSRQAAIEIVDFECGGELIGTAKIITKRLSDLPPAQPEPCDLCSNLEKGDTLYQYSDWDGGIGFDYIRDIQFCPKCGRRLNRWI